MLEAKGLKKLYALKGKGAQSQMPAVNGVDITLQDGVSYALVGESGSGKSTLAKLLTGLISPSEGDIFLDGKSLVPKNKVDKSLHIKIQLILQDGKSALDPHFTVYDSIAEPIRNLLSVSRLQEKEMVLELMERMELPAALLKRTSGELSGGQQKRVCIARAISVSPRILIFDEAVSGLDVIVRKSILQLLKRLQQEQQCTYLFITHDIDVALYIANHIFVMKDGRIAERAVYDGDVTVFMHPYSKLLLESISP